MTLYKRGSVYWSYFYRDGRRLQRSTQTSNRRLAEGVERRLKEEATVRRFQLPESDPDMTFGELAARFLAQANATPKAFHLSRLDQLLPHFADMPVLRISKGLARDYRVERHRRKKLTEATINRDLACLRHILNWAVEQSLLPVNPLQRLRLEPERRVHACVLSVGRTLILLTALSIPPTPKLPAASLVRSLSRLACTRCWWLFLRGLARLSPSGEVQSPRTNPPGFTS